MNENVYDLRSRQPQSAPTLICPGDPYLAALDARIVSEVAAFRLGTPTAFDRARLWAEARSLALGYRAEELTLIEEPRRWAEAYVQQVFAVLRGMPEEACTKLRHPSCAGNRAAQQQIIEQALGRTS
jgi:hypothetical protein